MTDNLIVILDKVLKLFADKGGVCSDNDITNFLTQNNIDSNLIIVINNLISYELIARNPARTEIKHLTPNGFKAAKTGLSYYLTQKRRNEFFNGFKFKLVIFIVPTLISFTSLILTLLNNNKIINPNEYYTREQVDSIISNKYLNGNVIREDTLTKRK